MGECDAAEQRHAIGQERKAERTDGDADEDETQYRTKPQPMEKRNYDSGRCQDDQGWLEQPWIEVRVQVSVSVFEQETMERLRHQAGRLDAGEMPRVYLDVFRAGNLLRHRLHR